MVSNLHFIVIIIHHQRRLGDVVCMKGEFLLPREKVCDAEIRHDEQDMPYLLFEPK